MTKVEVVCLVLLLALAACSTEKIVCENGNIVNKVEDCQTKDDAIEDTSENTPETKEETEISIGDVQDDSGYDNKDSTNDEQTFDESIDLEFKKLLENSKKAEAGYQFNSLDANSYEVYRVYVKDHILKIEYREDTVMDNNWDFDTIVFDKKKKSATAFCREKKICKTIEKSQLVYNDYILDELPLDIVKSITEGKLIDSMVCDKNHPCSRASFKDNKGREGTIFLDSYFGLPYEILRDGERLRYSGVSIGVRDDQLKIPR